jgi:predicted GIY-YIG superfamily endonuclease
MVVIKIRDQNGRQNGGRASGVGSMKVYVYGLYKKNFEYTTNKIDDGLFYIGISKNLKKRKNGHNSRINNPIKKAYINKYDYNLMVLYEYNSYEDALEMESFLIRWFGKISDNTGFLTNILTEPLDIKYCSKGSKRSTENRSEMSKVFSERPSDFWEKQRDERLTIPIEDINKILQEYEDSFPINKSDICSKYNISKKLLCEYISRYRPDLKNIEKQNKKKHIEKMLDSGLTQNEYAETIGVDHRTISLWKCKYIRDNKEIKSEIRVKDLDYKKQKYSEWMQSGLSKRQFCEENNINYASFKAWKKYYEEY